MPCVIFVPFSPPRSINAIYPRQCRHFLCSRSMSVATETTTTSVMSDDRTPPPSPRNKSKAKYVPRFPSMLRH